MSYKQSPFPMVDGTKEHTSALKQYVKPEETKKVSKYHYTKATGKDYTSPKTASHKREKGVTKAHNVAAEKLLPTGMTCVICGESRKGHSYTSGHQFKSSK